MHIKCFTVSPIYKWQLFQSGANNGSEHYKLVKSEFTGKIDDKNSVK
jgi:hypothetical protein